MIRWLEDRFDDLVDLVMLLVQLALLAGMLFLAAAFVLYAWRHCS